MVILCNTIVVFNQNKMNKLELITSNLWNRLIIINEEEFNWLELKTILEELSKKNKIDTAIIINDMASYCRNRNRNNDTANWSIDIFKWDFWLDQELDIFILYKPFFNAEKNEMFIRTIKSIKIIIDTLDGVNKNKKIYDKLLHNKYLKIEYIWK